MSPSREAVFLSLSSLFRSPPPLRAPGLAPSSGAETKATPLGLHLRLCPPGSGPQASAGPAALGAAAGLSVI